MPEYIVKEFGHIPILEKNLLLKRKKRNGGVGKVRPPVVTIMGHMNRAKLPFDLS